MADVKQPLQSLLLAGLDLLLPLWQTFIWWIAAAFVIYRGRSLADRCSVSCCVFRTGVLEERMFAQPMAFLQGTVYRVPCRQWSHGSKIL